MYCKKKNEYKADQDLKRSFNKEVAKNAIREIELEMSITVKREMKKKENGNFSLKKW